MPTEPTGQDLVRYYALRAQEYEEVYRRPERQEDLALLAALLKSEFQGQRVLDLASGTGYWTDPLSAVARTIVGLDINREVLQIAAARCLARRNVHFVLGDMYRPPLQPARFDAVLGAFIWSHVPLQDVHRFLDAAHALVRPGGRVVWVDNLYVEGNSTPLSDRDEHGNTYQQRRLRDGSLHRVLKNYPGREAMLTLLGTKVTDVHWQALKYYWLISYGP